jgi:hypothetical protein
MRDGLTRAQHLRRGFVQRLVDCRRRRRSQHVAGGGDVIRRCRERLVDLMRERCRHIRHCVKTIAVQAVDPRLKISPLAQIADNGDEQALLALTNSETVSSSGKLSPLLRRPSTSALRPMIFL